MAGIRKDYVGGRFSIVAKPGPRVTDPKNSPFAPGRESKTNPSVLSLVSRDGMLQRLEDADGQVVKNWLVRVFESSTPAVTLDPGTLYGDMPHYSEPAYGYHYVVVASPNPASTLTTLTLEEWSNAMVVVQDRLRWLYTKRGVTYVAVYANQGEEAGSRNPHSHLNIMTLSTIPPVVDAEIVSHHRTLDRLGVCPICSMVEAEAGGPREILKTEGFVAFTPWAPSHQHEFWICPMRHATSFAMATQKDINDLALMLRSTLGGLSKSCGSPAYSLAFHLSPEKRNTKQLHWHIEVYPVTQAQSALERGYGVFVSGTSPEDAAAVLGAAARREMARLVGIE